MTRQFIYILIAVVVAVIAFCYCFRQWADTKVFLARTCFRQYNGSAALVEKKYYANTNTYGCWWKPLDRPNLDERWDTCKDFEVGDVNHDYPEASYDCK